MAHGVERRIIARNTITYLWLERRFRSAGRVVQQRGFKSG